MNWQDIKSAVLAFFERFSQACWYQPEQELKPIPVESRPQQPARRRPS